MAKNNNRPFGFRDKFSYVMGDVGCNIVLTMANSYLLIFYTKVMGVSAGIVGTLFMLARFVDAFTDMAVGRIVDTRSFKNGDRFRPWIALGSIPLVISSILMYNHFLADAAMPVKIVYLIVTYLLFGSVCYTVVNIPYGAMSAVMSQDPGERSSLSTWRNVGSQFGGLILGMVIPMFVYVKDEAGNNVANGPRFLMVAIVLGVLALITLLICYAGTSERIRIANKTQEKKEKGGNMHAIMSCFKDRALLMNFGFAVFIYAASQVFMTFNQYMFLDYFGDTSLSGLASLVMFAGIMLSAPFATILGKKFGKKEVSVAGLALSTVTYAVLFVTRVTSPTLYFVGVFFAFFGIGLVTMVSYALMNDCIDNHYLETGDRADGTVYAMNSFMRKMAGAICTGLGGWGLTWINYNELAVVQTDAVRQGVFNLGIGFPAACFVFSLIFMIFFPLNKKKVDENTKKMTAIREANSKGEA